MLLLQAMARILYNHLKKCPMKILGNTVLILATLLIAACSNPTSQSKEDAVVAAPNLSLPAKDGFSDSLNGKKVELYILQAKGIVAAITNYGGRLVSLLVPDKEGKMTDVIIGFDTYKGFYESAEPFFGATIGRYGNRIANGRLSIDKQDYTLPINNGKNTLHGGPGGFHNVVWDGNQLNDSTLELSYFSTDGEQGFPGNLKVKVTYHLQSNGTMQIDYEASTDKTTVCNLTNHAFFNLNGSGTINNHLLTIHAEEYSPVDSTLIPLGKPEKVAGTPFDFRTPHAIGERVNEDNEQLKFGSGYDHNYVFSGKPDSLRMLCSVTADISGITMTIAATEPGLQFYGGNFMKSKNILKGGIPDEFRTAFCLEPQHFPNSPNEPSYPSTMLRPLEVYKTTSIYQFTANK